MSGRVGTTRRRRRRRKKEKAVFFFCWTAAAAAVLGPIYLDAPFAFSLGWGSLLFFFSNFFFLKPKVIHQRERERGSESTEEEKEDGAPRVCVTSRARRTVMARYKTVDDSPCARTTTGDETTELNWFCISITRNKEERKPDRHGATNTN